MNFLKQILIQLFPATCLFCKTLGEKEVCKDCLNRAHTSLEVIELPTLPELDQLYSLFSYEGKIKTLLHHIKFEDRFELGQEVGQTLVKLAPKNIPKAEIVIPIPVDKTRLKRRGFNQVTLLMQPLIQAYQAGEWIECCFRSKSTKALHALSKADRKQELENAFWIDPSVSIAGKSILLVDDIVTSGATLTELAKELRKKGASQIIGLTYAFTRLGSNNLPISEGKTQGTTNSFTG
jgi:ComF family protein